MNKDDRRKFAQYRQKVAQEYKDKINELKENNVKLLKENRELRDKVDELQQSNESLNEWVERMLEYTNMDRETLEKAKREIEIQAKTNDSLGRTMKAMEMIFGHVLR